MKAFIVAAAVFVAAPASAQDAPQQILLKQWNSLGNRVIAMAEEWPAEKYGYRPNDQVRTFGQIVVHIAAANYVAVNDATGKSNANFQDDPKGYDTKPQIVAYLKKSVSDGAAALQAGGDGGALKHLRSWISMIEHEGEHFGNLNTYYRLNGMVPPQSRPKPKAQLHWIEDDYEAALAQAQKRGVPILAEIWAPW